MAGPIDPRLLARAHATRGYLLAAVVVGSIGGALLVCQAWVLSRLMAHVFDTRSLEGLPFGGPATGLGLLAGIFAARGLLLWANSWLGQRAAAAVKSQLRRDITRARIDHPHSSATSTGALVELVTSGLDALDGYYAKYLPQLALALTVPLVVGVAIATADIGSAVIVALVIPLIPVFMILIGLATQKMLDRRWKVQTRLGNHFADLVQGLPTLQAFGRATAQVRGLEFTEGRHRAGTMSTLRVTFLSSLVLEILATYSVALVAVPLGLRLVEGHLGLATGLFVLMLVPEAFGPVRQVGVHYHDSVDGVAAAADAFAIIEGAEIEKAGPTASARANAEMSAEVRTTPRAGAIAFDGVDFAHPSTDTRTATNIRTLCLQNFSATVNPGEVVALVGPSGCGKSTALSLLMGFSRPSSGTIRLDGVDLARCDLDQWRRQVAWVAQQPALFSGTVTDNVALGALDDRADPELLAEVLRATGAWSIGPDRQVGDGGAELSGGEQRRVALARALLRIRTGARLLVLDEPTAGLDAGSEAAVIDAVRRTGAAALVVTHREAITSAADRVITLSRVSDPARMGP